MLDYLIVGLGLSGASIAFRLEESGKSFTVFEDESQQASKVAAGLINPVVLKRFTLAWKADEQLKEAKAFYGKLERHLEQKFLFPLEIYRKFSSVEEQNNWFEAADKPQLAPFLDTFLKSDINPFIPAQYSFGKVQQTARIDTNIFLDSYKAYLLRKEILQPERFNYQNLKISEEEVEYKGIKARKIIYCDGFGLFRNPVFNYLPLVGNKGEYIMIKAPELKLDVAVKSSVFIFPLGNDIYGVGATYNNKDKSAVTTSEAKEELVAKLDRMITAEYELVDQIAGVRPSTKDRRPLVGRHPKYENVYCCNGFGSRGILLAPVASKELLGYAEGTGNLSSEMDLSRFTKKYFKEN